MVTGGLKMTLMNIGERGNQMVTKVRLYDGEYNCVGPAGIWYLDVDECEGLDTTRVNYTWVRKEPAVARQVTFLTSREYADCLKEASANMVLDCDEILNFISLSDAIELAYRGILRELWV